MTRIKKSDIYDAQSESGIIGTLLCHPDYIAYSDHLKPEYFYEVEARSWYWAFKELYEKGITNFDSYNISAKLKSDEKVSRNLESVNLPSVEECMELYKEVARHTPQEYIELADVVVSLSFKRNLVDKLKEIETMCQDKSVDLESLSTITYSELDALTDEYVCNGEIAVIGDKIDSIWDDIEQTAKDGVESKYKSFTDYFRYEPGELVCLQARKKQGKSMFLLNETVHMIRLGLPTLVYDSEMNDRLYTIRLLSHLTGIPQHKISRKTYSPEEYEKIQRQKEWIKKQPLVHIYDPGMSMDKLYSICRSLQNSMGLSFVVYDYLKSNRGTTGENYNALGAMADYLKNNIAGKLNLPVLAAAQLNRNNETADSEKINNYSSVGIKWGRKSLDMVAKDGTECGNAYAKVFFNRIGDFMADDDEEDYLDFYFDGATATIVEAKPHEREEEI